MESLFLKSLVQFLIENISHARLALKVACHQFSKEQEAAVVATPGVRERDLVEILTVNNKDSLELLEVFLGSSLVQDSLEVPVGVEGCLVDKWVDKDKADRIRMLSWWTPTLLRSFRFVVYNTE